MDTHTLLSQFDSFTKILLEYPISKKEIVVASTCVVGVPVLYWLLSSPKPRSGCAPGPRGHWLFGNLFHLASKDAQNMEEIRRLHDIYGDVFEVTSRGLPAAIYCRDFNFMKQALSNEALSSRIPLGYNEVYHYDKGIIVNEGDKQKLYRTKGIHALRNLGVGKNVLEEKIECEAERFCNELALHCGKEIDVQDSIRITILNIIGNMSFTENSPYGKMSQFHQDVTDVTNFISFRLTLLSQIGVPLRISEMIIPRKDRSVLQAYRRVWREIETKVATISRDLELYDNFVTEFVKAETGGSKLTKTEMVRCVFDLYWAGYDTVSGSLYTLFRDFALHPSWQQEVYSELTQVIGDNRLPVISDLPNLKILKACITETMRLGTPVHLFPRRVKNDVTINGIFLPKDAVFTTNAHAMFVNPEVFEDPRKYNPRRFLKDSELVIPDVLGFFGYGNRYCLGDKLAQQELQLIMARVIQRFVILPPADDRNIDTGVKMNLTRGCNPYRVLIKER